MTAFGSKGRRASAASRLRVRIAATAAASAPVGRVTVALRLQDEPGAERLRQEERVARLRAALRPDPVGVDGADDGEPVLRLVVADRVASGEDRPGLAHDLVGSGEDLAQHLGRQLFGECGDREREQRHAAHREDVVERVRRRDRAEVARIVHDRWEEVDREDERALVVEPVDGSVVGRIEPDEQIGGLDRDEAARSVSSRAAGYFAAQPPAFASEVSVGAVGHVTSLRMSA